VQPAFNRVASLGVATNELGEWFGMREVESTLAGEQKFPTDGTHRVVKIDP